jgi:hypothetical protein
VKGQHLRKIEGRAQRWAARFDVDGTEQARGRFTKPPREIIAHALRLTSWTRMPRVEGSLVEADDLIRLVAVDVPALVEEVGRLRKRNEDLWARYVSERTEWERCTDEPDLVDEDASGDRADR